MSVQYTDQKQVYEVCIRGNPRNPYVEGYGAKIPTRYMIKYGYPRIWHRVYVICYSNAGSAYILYRGKRLFLDIDTEYKLKELG